MPSDARVDHSELRKFEAMAQDWWDPRGKFRPLHLMTPCRMDYIAGQIAAEFDRDLAVPQPLAGLTVLDIGCGGGLVAEPMARLGATVTAIDPAEANVAVARLHAAEQGLEIDYRCTTAEALLAEAVQVDVVLCIEVIEHVPDPQAFVAACAGLLRPGGLLICSTLNRTARSFALAIVAAEHLLRWLPPGTHDWRRFVTPDELAVHLRAAGLEPVDRKGMVYAPLTREWSLSAQDLSVNYITASIRPA